MEANIETTKEMSSSEKIKLIKNESYSARARYGYMVASPWTNSRFVDTRILALKRSPSYLILECLKIPLIAFDFYLFALFLSSLKFGDVFIELLASILLIVFVQRVLRYHTVGRMSMSDIDELNLSIDKKLESVASPTPRRKITTILIVVAVFVILGFMLIRPN